ncbi:hypothetical protein ACGFZW_38455, partial [Streptomyces sp. NPDC048248]
SLMPLRLARYGVPLARTAPAGLAAAGIAPAALTPAGTAAEDRAAPVPPVAPGPGDTVGPPHETPAALTGPTNPEAAPPHPAAAAEPEISHALSEEPPAPEAGQDAAAPQLTVPVGPGRSRPLGSAGGVLPIPEQRGGGPVDEAGPVPAAAPEPEAYAEPADPATGFAPDPGQLPPLSTLPDDIPRDEAYFTAYRAYVAEKNGFPDSRQFGRYLLDFYGVTGRDGGPLSEGYLRGFVRDFRLRLRMEMETEHIP